MDRQLVADILTGDSDEIAEIKTNLTLLEGFINLARELDVLPEISKRFYEENRSLYQATSSNRSLGELETFLARFFGPPVKPAGKPLPRKLRKSPVLKSLGGVEKDQSLFLLPLKTGEFYGALWPWRRNKGKVEIHLGYCSDWMVDEDYLQLETLVKRSLSHSAFQQMDTAMGGRIRGIGLASFLQMAEMEQSSFSLRISSAGRYGQVHVKEGQLIAAETGDRAGRDAAYHIITWDDVTIEIAPADPSKQDEINQPLMHVLMESLKAKDEITSSAKDAPGPPPRPKSRRLRTDAVNESKRLVRLERAPAPKMPRKGIRLATLLAVVLGALVVGGSAWVLGLYIANTGTVASERYAQLRAQVDGTESSEKKIELLQTYLQTHPQSPNAAEIESRIVQIRKHMEERDFELITLQISNLPVDEEYERKAISLYGDFLEKYPDSAFQQRIAGAVRDIKNLLDQYYYEELVRAAKLDFSQRLQVYKQYLARFPQGRYQNDVDVLIQAMGRQHLNFLKSENAACEQNQRWEACVQRYESFITEFKNTPLAEAAAAVKTALQDKRDLVQLRRFGAEAGTDYAKAHQAYREYLDKHPQSTQKEALEKEIATLSRQLQTQSQWKSVQAYALNAQNDLFERIQYLDRYLREHLSSPYAPEAQELMNKLESQRAAVLRQSKIEARKQAETDRVRREKEKQAQQQVRVRQLRGELEQQLSDSQRYRVNGDGSFIDQTTGLSWALLDSYQELGGCLNFHAAQQYIQSLPPPPNGAWRLPTASDLAKLYKQSPFYPSSGAEWYWTSEAYVRGYHSVADVVTTKHETVFQREYRRQDECGAVRAVR
ncbi:MAG: DUF4388 domain-containing protein [Desulfobacteraceae bacterium]|nr:MAG: DUF4388 domain-containing protein [Desulfobacteraceae bacterium]